MRRLSVSLALVLTAGLLIGSAAPASAGLPPTEWVIGPQRRIVMITFDGQMKSQHLIDILDKLAVKGATATFFVSGSWIDHHVEKAELIVAAGHFLGNRGYSNVPFTTLGDEDLRNSITKAEDSIESVGGSSIPYLRAPDGARDLRILQVAGGLGYRSVRWTYRAGGGATPAVVGQALRHAQAGSIVSLEPWRRSHRNALGKIIDGLRDRGFGLRTIDAIKRVHAIRWDVTVSEGSSGSEVAFLQKELNSITYPAGKADGSFGYATLEATYAFEKYTGLTRDGVVPPLQMEEIAKAQRPRTPDRGPRNFVDIDISKQILLEVKDRRVIHTIPISSGNEEYYTVDGQTYKAHTPRGNFKIERKILGERESRLGILYDPNYFTGGYAIHGSQSVPTYPASHGCVRIPMYLSRPFYDRNPIGRYVFVHD